MATKSENQQKTVFDNQEGQQQQQQPAKQEPAPQAKQEPQAAVAVQQTSKAAQEEGLIKISQGLPAVLKPLQNCFTAPYKTFVQEGKDIRDLQRECNFAAQAMLANPYLVDCAKAYPDDFVNALKNVVLTGMTLNPTLNLAYLVPYKGHVKMQTSWMGKKSFAVNTGLVLDITPHLVYKGDFFEVEHGTNAHITHKPNPWGMKKQEDILGGYYVIIYPNGIKDFDTMTIEEIDNIRKRSPSVGKGKISPWDTDYTEMCKKTLINRAYKQIPKQDMSEKARKALEIINSVDDQAAKDINYGQKQKYDDFDEAEEVQ